MSATADGGLVFTDRAHRGRSRGGIAVRRGVRVDAAWWRGIPPWERYRLRVEAASQALADPVFALESAAVLHGLPIFGEPAHIHVLASPGSRGHRSGDVIRHLRTAEADVVRVEGIQVTSVEDTVVALLRVLPIALAVAVADAAVRRGISVDVLRGRLERQTDRRGRARASAALDLTDGRSESVLESSSRVVIAYLGYPDPELQVEFSLPSGRARVDFLWRSESVVGEADGRGKYFRADVRTDDAVHAERRREIELRRVVRDVARWEWADVITPGRLDAILRAAGLRRIRPIDPRLPAALDDRRGIRRA